MPDCCRSGFVKNGMNKKARTHILRSRKCCGPPLAHFNFSIYFSLFWGVCFRRAHMRCACGMRAPMDYFSLNFATSLKSRSKRGKSIRSPCASATPRGFSKTSALPQKISLNIIFYPGGKTQVFCVQTPAPFENFGAVSAFISANVLPKSQTRNIPLGK